MSAARPGAGKIAARPARYWSDDEAARLIAVAVPVLRVGGSLITMRAAVAAALGRSALGVQCKLREDAGLAARLAQALARADGGFTPAKAVPVPPPEPAAAPVAAPVPGLPRRKPGSVAGVSVFDATAYDPLTAHLAALPRGEGWTLARDFALLEGVLARAALADIAAQLAVARCDAIARLDRLQARDPATGRRRFACDLVRGALRRLAQGEGLAG